MDFRKVYSVVHYRRQNSVFAVVAVYCLYIYHSVYHDFVVVAVDGIGKIKLPDKNYGDVEVIIENADKADLKNAKEMGVSIAKARAIAEYTKQNGGSIEENVHKLENQSVKEIRRNLENKSEVKTESKKVYL